MSLCFLSDVITGLLQIFHQWYPKGRCNILALVWIHATQCVVTIMFLDFKSLSYFPIELIVNDGYRTGFIELDRTRTFFAVLRYAGFVNFFFCHIFTVFFEPSFDLFLRFTTIWGYATGARDLVYTGVAVPREFCLVFLTKALNPGSCQT